MGEDKEGFIDDGGVVELSIVPIVEEDWPLTALPLDWESVEVVVRKLALERRRSSLNIDISFSLDCFLRFTYLFLSFSPFP